MTHRWCSVLLCSLATCACSFPRASFGGKCADAEFCAEPYPAENSRDGDAYCHEGMMCGPDSPATASLCGDKRIPYTADCTAKSTERTLGIVAPLYVIISLGTHGGWSSIGLGINQLGQVAGGADTPEGKRHAFLWDSGTMRDLGTPPRLTVSEAGDINNVAQVVGVALGSTRSPMHAFFWEEGQGMVDLGNLAGGEASALAINDAGTVVGYATGSHGYWQAFIWDDGIMTPIPNDLGGLSSMACDINDAGQIVGAAATTTSMYVHAFLRTDGEMQNLGTLGGDFSRAHGVNDLGAVVGYSERAPPEDGVLQAFLWNAGEMTDLGALEGFLTSRPWAINNDGQVVGLASRKGPLLGFFYDPDSGMSDVDSLISPNSGWSNLMPRDINNAGQMVGDGAFRGRRLAFLMTPLDADFNDNGQTGLEDFAVLHGCLSGPGVAVDGTCEACDVNRDGSVDLTDVQLFQWAFRGF